MKKILYTCLLIGGLSGTALAQDASIFPRGEVATVNNHTGTVWLKELSHPDSLLNIAIATASFAPGAKLDWHTHPSGQILMITDGTGYYQEKGRSIQIVHKGDVIKCHPGIPHWHGAAPKSNFTYIAVSTNSANNKTVWLQRVTDEEYNSAKNKNSLNPKF